MNRRSILARLAGLLAASAAGPARPAAGAGVIPVFRRGIGVSHALGWAEVGASGSYAEPPFAEPRFRFGAEQMGAIRQAGFDFVRLVVDIGPFLALTGARRDRLDDHLLGIVSALLDADLGVVVDLHPSRMHPAYRPDALTGGVDTPPFKAVLALLTRLSARLGSLAAARAPGPPRLALELLNEPEVSPAAWQPMLEAAYRAARAGAARLPLVLGGGSMNAATALEAIDPSPFDGDGALLYTFHDYEPWQFTHQGLRGNPAYVLDAVPYPAPAAPEAMLRATEARIAGLALDETGREQARAAPRNLADYARSGFDAAALETTFARVTAWRAARGLPAHAVLLGEFGVSLTPYGRTRDGAAARARWLHDMRTCAERHGFAWACWTYVGPGGFALAENEAGPGFDAATLRALGLVR